eukprot:CAMPEP_0194375538 /NCGR_PEP_ID=MMETSP0174-20130528/24070_1 /TAXON_ID=216777 /ORGANISM="Proboscia alata, Strain PI-D3" /LENGTH=1683 /DNA_ID=CAMNT_0039155803 /DNA_START=346 /DNA_END=5397 /DNA_ORIENTATION=-
MTSSGVPRASSAAAAPATEVAVAAEAAAAIVAEAISDVTRKKISSYADDEVYEEGEEVVENDEHTEEAQDNAGNSDEFENRDGIGSFVNRSLSWASLSAHACASRPKSAYAATATTSAIANEDDLEETCHHHNLSSKQYSIKNHHRNPLPQNLSHVEDYEYGITGDGGETIFSYKTNCAIIHSNSSSSLSQQQQKKDLSSTASIKKTTTNNNYHHQQQHQTNGYSFSSIIRNRSAYHNNNHYGNNYNNGSMDLERTSSIETVISRTSSVEAVISQRGGLNGLGIGSLETVVLDDYHHDDGNDDDLIYLNRSCSGEATRTTSLSPSPRQICSTVGGAGDVAPRTPTPTNNKNNNNSLTSASLVSTPTPHKSEKHPAAVAFTEITTKSIENEVPEKEHECSFHNFHCVVCYRSFDTTKHYPVVLPCGHTYVCHVCASKMKQCMKCNILLHYVVPPKMPLSTPKGQLSATHRGSITPPRRGAIQRGTTATSAKGGATNTTGITCSSSLSPVPNRRGNNSPSLPPSSSMISPPSNPQHHSPPSPLFLPPPPPEQQQHAHQLQQEHPSIPLPLPKNILLLSMMKTMDTSYQKMMKDRQRFKENDTMRKKQRRRKKHARKRKKRHIVALVANDNSGNPEEEEEEDLIEKDRKEKEEEMDAGFYYKSKNNSILDTVGTSFATSATSNDDVQHKYNSNISKGRNSSPSAASPKSPQLNLVLTVSQSQTLLKGTSCGTYQVIDRNGLIVLPRNLPQQETSRTNSGIKKSTTQEMQPHEPTHSSQTQHHQQQQDISTSILNKLLQPTLTTNDNSNLAYSDSDNDSHDDNDENEQDEHYSSNQEPQEHENSVESGGGSQCGSPKSHNKENKGENTTDHPKSRSNAGSNANNNKATTTTTYNATSGSGTSNTNINVGNSNKNGNSDYPLTAVSSSYSSNSSSSQNIHNQNSLQFNLRMTTSTSTTTTTTTTIVPVNSATNFPNRLKQNHGLSCSSSSSHNKTAVAPIVIDDKAAVATITTSLITNSSKTGNKRNVTSEDAFPTPRTPPPIHEKCQDATTNTTQISQISNTKDSSKYHIDDGSRPFQLLFGDRIQVLKAEDGCITLARHFGYMFATIGKQIMKVGGPLDKACQLKGMAYTLSKHKKTLKTLSRDLNSIETNLAKQLKWAILLEDEITTVAPSQRHHGQNGCNFEFSVGNEKIVLPSLSTTSVNNNKHVTTPAAAGYFFHSTTTPTPTPTKIVSSKNNGISPTTASVSDGGFTGVLDPTALLIERFLGKGAEKDDNNNSKSSNKLSSSVEHSPPRSVKLFRSERQQQPPRRTPTRSVLRNSRRQNTSSNIFSTRDPYFPPPPPPVINSSPFTTRVPSRVPSFPPSNNSSFTPSTPPRPKKIKNSNQSNSSTKSPDQQHRNQEDNKKIAAAMMPVTPQSLLRSADRCRQLKVEFLDWVQNSPSALVSNLSIPAIGDVAMKRIGGSSKKSTTKEETSKRASNAKLKTPKNGLIESANCKRKKRLASIAKREENYSDDHCQNSKTGLNNNNNISSMPDKIRKGETYITENKQQQQSSNHSRNSRVCGAGNYICNKPNCASCGKSLPIISDFEIVPDDVDATNINCKNSVKGNVTNTNDKRERNSNTKNDSQQHYIYTTASTPTESRKSNDEQGQEVIRTSLSCDGIPRDIGNSVEQRGLIDFVFTFESKK